MATELKFPYNLFIYFLTSYKFPLWIQLGMSYQPHRVDNTSAEFTQQSL